MNQQLQQRQLSPAARLKTSLDRKSQTLTAALPDHIDANRMISSVMNAVRENPALLKCTPESVFKSVMTAAQLGLQVGVGGQGYLIPYGQNCNYVPGWRGLVDLVTRSRQGLVWTGCVRTGDSFDYELGARPYTKHKPGDSLCDSAADIELVYAVGYPYSGAEFPVIEVWSTAKCMAHLSKHNKVGKRHYAYDNLEMYFRKLPLLQVLKYMPTSTDISNAVEVSHAGESGKNVTIEGSFVSVEEDLPTTTPTQNNDSSGQDDYSQYEEASVTEPVKREMPSGRGKKPKEDNAEAGPTYAEIRHKIENSENAAQVNDVMAEAGHLTANLFEELQGIATNQINGF